MRIGVASSFACGVGLWKRLADEGAEVKVWRGDYKADSPTLLTSHRLVGEGIVPLTDSWHDLAAWVKETTGPALLLFDSSGLGKLADEARGMGIRVVGGGTFCDRLEKDRAFGREIAHAAGMESPDVLEFASIDACLDFAKGGKLDRAVYWKTDSYIEGDATHRCQDAEELVDYLTWIKKRARANQSCILEECLDGFALSTARYWNGSAWLGPYEWTLERKAHMTGDVGPATGCALNAVGFYEAEVPAIAKALHWDALAEAWLAHEAPPGYYDANAIVFDGEAKFLEWTPRIGWDSGPTSYGLLDDLSAFLWRLASGQGDAEPERGEIALGLRLTVGPAPWEHGERDEKGSCVGVPVRGDTGDLWSEGFFGYQLQVDEDGLAVAAPEGLVGLSVAVGDKTSALAEEVVSFARDCLRVPGLQYRCDIGEAVREDAEKCADEGFGDNLPSGLGE